MTDLQVIKYYEYIEMKANILLHAIVKQKH